MPCRRALAAALLATALGQQPPASPGAQSIPQCPGDIQVGGLGRTSVVATQWNQPGMPAAPVHNENGVLKPDMWGRAYFADTCVAGMYDNTHYSSIPLLGKKISYITDLSQAGCGCNAAFYLVVMKPNAQVSGCYDYYCDANSVCQINCDEIDIMEANRYAFHSALHKEYDGNGISQGYGGFTEGDYAFSRNEYGPGARCIDTNKPFQVAASFPKDSAGKLRGLEVTLTQSGSPCTVSLGLHQYNADPNFAHLTQSLAQGMTPVVSYWQANNMLWLDGPGNHGRGPCQSDDVRCGPAPSFSNFTVEDLSVRYI